MQRYEQYIDSGIEWLDEIPEHWKIQRLKTVLDIFGRIGFRGYTIADLVNKNEGAITLSPSNIVNFQMDILNCSYLSWQKYYESPEIMIYNKDILFVKTGSTYGKSSLVENLTERATINPQLVVFKNIICNNTLLKYILQSYYLRIQIENSVIGGTIPTISQEKISNYRILLPTIQEQEAIAKFLDIKCEQIDRAIAQKERVIELLNERRQIIIQRAVTRGLNPDVELKDSGIDWIGEIPRHWEMKKVKYALNQISIKEYSLISSLPYIGMENIEAGTGKYIESISEIEGLANRYFYNNVIFGKLRPYLAKVYLTQDNGICSTEFIVYDMKDNLARYIQKLLISANFISKVNASTYGSKMPRANSNFVGNLYLPIPPISEQQEIANYLDNISEKIDKAISIKKEEIARLKEYKQTLINSAVTGKIKIA